MLFAVVAECNALCHYPRMTRENTEAKAFARRLRDLMAAAGHVSPGAHSGVDVGKLAEVAGVSYEMARRYAEGLAMPRPGNLTKIAKWLRVSSAELAYGENPKTNTIDEGVLRACLGAVQEAQARTGVVLTPERAAHLVAVLYAESLAGELPTTKTLDLMLRATT